jgi:hypothetical protein
LASNFRFSEDKEAKMAKQQSEGGNTVRVGSMSGVGGEVNIAV